MNTLLVLAAGMGSRFGGLKQIEGLGPCGETLLDYSVFDALEAGFQRVVFLIRRDIHDVFRERVGSRYEGRLAVDYAYQETVLLPAGFSPPPQRTKPWGTGHAIWCAREVISGPFAAINADDYYGRSAFTNLAAFLSAPPAAEPGAPFGFAMVGYALDRTLSESGSVSRGLCVADAHGMLRSIEEITGIVRGPDSITGQRADGSLRSFSGSEPVSMNCWAFTPEVFPLLDEQLHGFLRVSGQDLKAEFYIPSAIAHMIEARKATVRVLTSDASWFGVTYREDMPAVAAALAELTAQGAYPSPLWGKG